MDDEIKKEHYSMAYLRQQAQAFLSETGLPEREFSKTELTALLHEFYIQQAEMEIRNEELRKTLEMLDAERRRFSDYFETAPIGYFVLDENSAIDEVNLAGADLLGVQRQHIKGRLLSRFVSPSFRSGYYRHLQAVKEEFIRQSCEVEMLRPDGQPLPVRLDSIAILDQNGLTGLRTAMTDLSGRRRIETEERQQDSTVLWTKAEENAREKAREQSQSLAQRLDDLRTVMEMMLQEKDGGRRALEENISANLRQVIFPEIRNLKQKSRDKEIRRLLLLLEKELEQLTSAFSSTLSSSRYGLTPMEIRISALIRDGLTTDEISEHLHIASKTVSFHRSNIRKKLGIKNRKLNLQTYLLNLF